MGAGHAWSTDAKIRRLCRHDSKETPAKKAARVHSIGRGGSFETAVRKPRTQKKNIGAFGGIELKINYPRWQPSM
jgi:hypothetical protein